MINLSKNTISLESMSYEEAKRQFYELRISFDGSFKYVIYDGYTEDANMVYFKSVRTGREIGVSKYSQYEFTPLKCGSNVWDSIKAGNYGNDYA